MSKIIRTQSVKKKSKKERKKENAWSKTVREGERTADDFGAGGGFVVGQVPPTPCCSSRGEGREYRDRKRMPSGFHEFLLF
ncbi:hypothetical protein CEXT_739751 [Caerostris extrusa]|uniref:Uncharacterized protein n=1 Tax=Caerostris extrusa TaxID=172846 RepID=A0AAV4U8E4_CAEEX|nr:hypothetical protein CEXT_739751 [Caerostris extrusa]